VVGGEERWCGSQKGREGKDRCENGSAANGLVRVVEGCGFGLVGSGSTCLECLDRESIDLKVIAS